MPIFGVGRSLIDYSSLWCRCGHTTAESGPPRGRDCHVGAAAYLDSPQEIEA